ncbi:hypothetical protein IAG44_21420 [Streptomyces roseirectus]|uniref:Uncharacterized protein n=1 Tax=Streptomyces roseirectus TaxID=2768066 RepID=A0A7H0IG18_9ACTN|nr:hypothetical protein [Streptomyces roseirectus]QNP71734.1 hypothetical protein IAG44_21420 [Streptomyces roseirectus]
MTYRPRPHQITQVPPSYVTPPPKIPQPAPLTRRFTLCTLLLTATSVLSLATAIARTL